MGFLCVRRQDAGRLREGPPSRCCHGACIQQFVFFTPAQLCSETCYRNRSGRGTIREQCVGFPKGRPGGITNRDPRGTIRWIREEPLLFVQWKDTSPDVLHTPSSSCWCDVFTFRSPLAATLLACDDLRMSRPINTTIITCSESFGKFMFLHMSFQQPNHRGCAKGAPLHNCSTCETLMKYAAITQLLYSLRQWPWDSGSTARSNSRAKLKSGLSDQAGVFDVQR